MLSEGEIDEQGVDSSADSPADSSADGRRARRERGRAAVVRAAIDLFHEGRVRPTAEELAARSGVSVASVFRYFDSLDDLHRVAFDQQLDAVRPMLSIPGLHSMTTPERVGAFVKGRIDVYEVIAGTARTSRARAADHPVIAESLVDARRRWLLQVHDVFAAELDPMTAARRRDVAAMIDATTSFECWDLLERAHGLPRRSIRSQWGTAIDASLASAL